jgi:hypothetical protein
MTVDEILVFIPFIFLALLLKRIFSNNVRVNSLKIVLLRSYIPVTNLLVIVVKPQFVLAHVSDLIF